MPSSFQNTGKVSGEAISKISFRQFDPNILTLFFVRSGISGFAIVLKFFKNYYTIHIFLTNTH